ncbi:hypothetical protein A9Q99_00335 [Gammaproteobacteria bacterium 45_16_T64]|nr:hypothetical protein A9Q99_00335 [Gammaproteobacteria bacterium 45_16_T64]
MNLNERCKVRILVLFLIISGSVYGDTNAKIISMAVTDWPPYTGTELLNYGIASEIVTESFRKVGYTTEMTFMPWARLLEEVRIGNYDGAVAAYWTKDRAESYRYSESFLKSPLVFYKRTEDQITWSEYEDLKNYRIGIVRSYANSKELDQADYLDKEVVNTDIFNLKKLLAGHIDLAVIDQFVAQNIIISDIGLFRDLLEPIEPALAVHSLHVMFTNNRPNANVNADLFHQGLAILKEDGGLSRILHKHGFD